MLRASWRSALRDRGPDARRRVLPTARTCSPPSLRPDYNAPFFMRIAHVVTTFPPYFAGTGGVCYHNALHLARLGHEVTILTQSYGNAREEAAYDPPRVSVVRLPVRWPCRNTPI